MSASPAKTPSGPSSNTPTGGLAPGGMRKKAPVSIFTTKKKPVAKKATTIGKTSAAPQAPNGAPRPATNGVGLAPAPPAEEKQTYQDYSIYVTRDVVNQGLHYHAMHLKTKADKQTGNTVYVNPYDETQFTRPVRLHRRNARDKREAAELSDAASGVDDKDKEHMSILKAQRQAEKEANKALIAPTGGETNKPQRRKPQKKVEDVYYDENNERHRARAQLRYEEARPWHLEDFDGSNIWIGSYEEPLSDSSVMFEIGAEGFRLIPVEKWYRFAQTNKIHVMDSETVEKHMGQKFKAPRWFLGTQAANDEDRMQQARRAREARFASVRGADEDEMNPFMKREDYQADMDEIDFEFNDEFQDDDEGAYFGDQQDDDAKEIEKKIREEMREANLGGTGVKDEDKDWDEEEQKEKEKEQEEKKRSRRLRKQLIKKERKNEYDSESDRGEFSESDDSEDTEEERERLEEERKQEEAKKVNGDKSGASTKGTNTPNGRPEKRDTSKALGISLKRPGSPDLSEMSGNESSRKKAKGVNGRALNAPNGARSLSPDAAKNRGYGSGSDTDTSRTGRLKLKLKASPPASPHEGSRPGSRTQSPSSRVPFPTLEEVRAAIPPDGIVIGELVKIFKPRVLTRQADFIALVKRAGSQDKVSKKILPILEEGAEGAGAGEQA